MDFTEASLGKLSDEELLSLSKTAEAAERYEDMCKLMRELCNRKSAKDEVPTHDERNILSVAYKNVVGSKRASWRMLSHYSGDADGSLLSEYKKIVEDELQEVCSSVLDLIKAPIDILKKIDGDAMTADQNEDMVFYYKMGGDYSRYLAEFMQDTASKADVEENSQKMKQYYIDATAVAEKLPPTHPTRLGLALNYSVCCFEILREQEMACRLAKDAFDTAIEKLDSLGDSSYKDSTIIMQLLRDNLTLWTSDNADGGDEDNQDK